MNALGKLLWGFLGGLLGKLADIFRRRKQLKDAKDSGEQLGKAEGKNEVRNEEYREKVEEIRTNTHVVTNEEANKKVDELEGKLQ